MPDIKTNAQIFDIAFHPTESTVYIGLLTGGVKAFRYDEQGEGEPKQTFSVRPSKRSCRGLAISEDGSKLYAVGKGKAMYIIDTATGKVADSRLSIHQAPVNRIKYLTANLLSTGDDDGVVKLWDPRTPTALREYTHHFDFISDFMYIADKRQLVVTSGDGTLSVLDVRAKRTTPLAHSEDQEDELLSVVPIRGGEKTIVGTQQGILAVFNRSSGWGDCVDRVPGHPHSIDALSALPSSMPSSDSTILTGSSDGLLRAVQLFPTRLRSVVADHGAFPIERIAVDRAGEGSWVGSVGHDEVLRMTDLRAVLEEEVGGGEHDDGESDEESDGDGKVNSGRGANALGKRKDDSEDSDSEEGSEADPPAATTTAQSDSDAEERKSENDDADSDSDEPTPSKKRRKGRNKTEDVLGTEKKRRKKPKMDEVVADPSFFDDL